MLHEYPASASHGLTNMVSLNVASASAAVVLAGHHELSTMVTLIPMSFPLSSSTISGCSFMRLTDSVGSALGGRVEVSEKVSEEGWK